MLPILFFTLSRDISFWLLSVRRCRLYLSWYIFTYVVLRRKTALILRGVESRQMPTITSQGNSHVVESIIFSGRHPQW